jgi:predicted TIM-barrel fold metal-dependent hydrolase
VIDCDVHCPAPGIAELRPYLEGYYSEGLDLLGFNRPPAVMNSYPSWSKPFAGGQDVTLDDIRANVLDRAELAILQCYYGVESYTHPDLGSVLATAVNRWLADEWLDREPRLLGSAIVAAQNAPAAVREIERIASDGRFVQVLVPARSWEIYGNQRYWPIWEALAEHGLALCLTYGGLTGTPPTPVNWLGSFFEDYAAATLPFSAHVISLVYSGVFNRWPSLKVVAAESGWTWVPPMLWHMDQEWRAFAREVPWLAAPPSEYVRRHLRLTTQPTDAPSTPAHLRDVYDELGSDELLMFSSDYPHRYSAGVEPLLAQLTEAESERVLWRNAADCYGLGDRVA